MQDFSNNASTTLAALLTNSATTLTVDSSNGFADLSAGHYELVTLTDGLLTEIVKVTARTGESWTVARAQEGTAAASWPAGTTVEARLTAGTLDGLIQAADVPDLVVLDHGGNARGVEAVNIQTGRQVSTQVASGDYSVAIGFGSHAAGSDSTAIAPVATASAASATAVGHDATAAGAYSTALGADSSATGGGGIAVGYEAVASGMWASAIGGLSQAAAYRSVAVGPDSVALGDKSLAMLGRAAEQSSFAVCGGKAYGAYSLAFVIAATSDNSIVLHGYHTIARDEWNDQYERWSAGAQAAFCTPYVDLGVPPVWAAATAYDNGDIIQPTTGGTVQYRAWTNSPIETGIHETGTSTTTEPAWPGAGDREQIDADGNHFWIGIDWSAGYLTEEIPDGLTFFPTELAFICHEHSTLTGTPNISIGTAAAPGLLVDADDVPITGAPQIYRFTLANPNAGIPSGTAIQIKVHTFASAGRCVGRFLLSGFFVENPTNAV